MEKLNKVIEFILAAKDKVVEILKALFSVFDTEDRGGGNED